MIECHISSLQLFVSSSMMCSQPSCCSLFNAAQTNVQVSTHREQHLCNSMTCYQVSLTLFHLVPSLRKDTLYSGTGSHSNYEHDYCNGCTSHSLHQCQQVQRSHQMVIYGVTRISQQVPVVNISGDILHTIKPVFSQAIDIDFIILVLTPVWWFASVHHEFINSFYGTPLMFQILITYCILSASPMYIIGLVTSVQTQKFFVDTRKGEKD